VDERGLAGGSSGVEGTTVRKQQGGNNLLIMSGCRRGYHLMNSERNRQLSGQGSRTGLGAQPMGQEAKESKRRGEGRKRRARGQLSGAKFGLLCYARRS